MREILTEGTTRMRAPLLTWTIAVLAMTNLAPGAPAQVSAPGPTTTSTENATGARPSVESAQPVPGAMVGSDAVPSTISERNASDDQLPTLAFRLRNLTDDQRRAILRSVKPNGDRSTGTSYRAPPEVGMVIPQNEPLRPLPPELGDRIAEVKDLQYKITDDAVLLVDPIQRAVLAVLSQ
jgi:hypothetical protein